MRNSLVHSYILRCTPSPVEENATFGSRKRKGGDEKEAVCQVGSRTIVHGSIPRNGKLAKGNQGICSDVLFKVEAVCASYG